MDSERHWDSVLKILRIIKICLKNHFFYGKVTQPPRCPDLAGCKDWMLLLVISTFMSSPLLKTFLNISANIVNGLKLMKEIKVTYEMMNFIE